MMLSTLARRSLPAALLGLVCTLAAAAPAPEKEKLTPEEVARAEKAVKDHLEKIKGAHGNVQVIKDEPLARLFPRYAFITVLYRQFPVARVLPEGLKASNVFAVGADGKFKLLNDAKGLEEFFKANLPPVTSADQAKDVARAWVRLGEEFHQDGFFKFTLMDDSTRVEGGDEGRTASALVVVMQGGNGSYAATVKLDSRGRLVKVEEMSKIRPGPRPICQATKLLDPDPLVRRMAEQDLRIMGTAARAYLMEQRAQARPELQQAIDRLWKQIQEEEAR
jgi:hypothetical protein